MMAILESLHLNLGTRVTGTLNPGLRVQPLLATRNLSLW